MTRNLLLSTALIAASAAMAQADSLTIGLKAEHPSMDPHFSRTSPGQNTAAHIFEGLTSIDENMQLVPALATEWTNIDPTTWEIKLRDGVTFHDGSTFDAQDVITTVARVPKVENSAASFESNVAMIENIEAVDPLTLRITTKAPSPDLMQQFGSVYILPSELGDEIASTSFDSGESAIGTGPYTYGDWMPNEKLTLSAYDDYWGEAPAFDDVTIRYIPNDAGRVSALIAGDVDLIDAMPAGDLAAVESRMEANIVQKTSGRMIYLGLDSDRADSPFVKGPDGGEIENPLRDARVRRALSLMIDRGQISERIMDGTSTPTGQMVPEGFTGYTAAVEAPQADVEEAQRLLEEAGYGDGFTITLHGPNNRYQNDAKILQAVSQLWARAGLNTSVEAMPKNIYFGRASARDFSAFLVGFGTTTGDSIRGLQQVIGTYDEEGGTGRFNRGRFSSAEFDALVQQAAETFDADERQALLEEATAIAFNEEQAIIPIHLEQQIWAMKDTLSFDARPIERTLAQDVQPAE
ncbi:ABC transporter substrate-binding protein [Thalassorhabdomicrobium marinisediminis]|uniref:ABC transporter substrate-binding protein n=1 Tax=Thalassorhabdomicrobium marinisediminis TaxID=2170577 RepID=UPI0024925BB6|nr:ABC transporter substrate-binding protein [Thalassorhabdomicrobium marinisediminis]